MRLRPPALQLRHEGSRPSEPADLRRLVLWPAVPTLGAWRETSRLSWMNSATTSSCARCRSPRSRERGSGISVAIPRVTSRARTIPIGGRSSSGWTRAVAGPGGPTSNVSATGFSPSSPHPTSVMRDASAPGSWRCSSRDARSGSRGSRSRRALRDASAGVSPTFGCGGVSRDGSRNASRGQPGCRFPGPDGRSEDGETGGRPNIVAVLIADRAELLAARDPANPFFRT
jgi:hypothetical protein